jgi:hypothetical protein
MNKGKRKTQAIIALAVIGRQVYTAGELKKLP